MLLVKTSVSQILCSKTDHIDGGDEREKNEKKNEKG
jgi:hypothetical protein